MVRGHGKVIGVVKINLKIFKIQKDVLVFVLDNSDFCHDFLIGLDLISAFRLCQDENLEIFQRIGGNPRTTILDRSVPFINNAFMSADLDHLDANKAFQISQIISDFNRIFAKNKFDVGRVTGSEASVKLTEHRYVYRKPYRCNIVDQKEIETQISKLFKAGLIEESTSPFAAPVTLAFKKQSDGSRLKNRLCIDFSALNKIIVPESQPFPRIEDLIVKARDCQWFSVLDINSAFWSVPLRQKDRYKTAFVTQTGHYNWKCLPFGLKTSPAIFQRILRNILKRNGLDDFSVNYIDDILVFSKTFDQHLGHLKKILDAIFEEGFRLSLPKCEFAKSKVKYLGHIIENNSIHPVYDNVLPVRDFPVPKNQKNVRQFLGKVNFYHSYIPNSAIVLAPLHNLLKKNVPFVWNDKCEASFNKIKQCLISEPCLAIFNPERETIVFTDASLEGIGAVLKQKQSDGNFKPVAFFSKKLNEAQKRKKAIFLECLAIKEALMYWRHRLLGIRFTVVSDHKPLENLKINTKFDDELRELMLHLSHFDFNVKYMPGKTNLEADCLSRNPVLESHEALSELKVVNFLELKEILDDQKRAFHELPKDCKVNDKNKIIFVKRGEKSKVIVSDKLAKELIRRVHFKFGHIGIKQMELTIFPYFFNSNFRKFISLFCKNCSICVKNKSRIPAKFGSLSQLGPATRPFEYMSIDTIGGFTGNNSSKKYIHLLVDHFSRYAYTLTSSTQKTGDFVKLLKLVLDKGHKVKNLLADQYTAINSNVFKEFLKQNGINLFFTAVDCPFSNGLNERLNQTLVNRLRCKVNESNVNKKKPWSTLFSDCVSEYNNTIHSVTKFSPNYLMYGIKDKFISELNVNVTSSLLDDRKLAFLNSKKNHDYNSRVFNRNKSNFDFKVGDLVFVDHGNSLNKNKLDEVRSGPFKIVKKISNVLFEVDSGFQKYESNIYHTCKMYPFFSSF